MKIIFIAHQTKNKSNGGLESATRIFESLSKSFQWVLITNKSSAFTRRWKENGASVYILDWHSTSLVNGIAKILISIYKLKRIVKEEKPNLFHANDIRSAFLVHIYKIIYFNKLPFVFTIRDLKPQPSLYSQKWSNVVNKCNKVITLSYEMSEKISEYLNFNPDKITCISSIVDHPPADLISPTQRNINKRSLNIKTTITAVACIGAFMEKKGQKELIAQIINNADNIFKEFENLYFYFLGDFNPSINSYANECLDLVSSSQYSARFIFQGHTDDISKWYKAIDILLIASKQEGLARAMIEAMSYGVPVLSFNVCSAKEMLVLNDAGIVVNQGEYSTLLNTLLSLISDNQKLVNMGNNGKLFAASHFSKKSISNQYMNLYTEL